MLVGNETVVREALGPRPGEAIPGVIDAPQSITMEESGPLAIHRKREASVSVALRMLAAGEVDALVRLKIGGS